MRALHTADPHIGLATYGRSIEEFARTLNTFADIAIAERVDAAIIAGDLFDRRNPGPNEIKLGVRPVKRIAEAGIDVVIGPGNHDGEGTIADAESHTMAWWAELPWDNVHVATGPELLVLPYACFAVLPYVHRRAIVSTATVRERTDQASRELEEQILDLARLPRPSDRPLVFVGHLSTIHARLGSEAAMQMGWDTMVDPEVFDAFDLAALGHIHTRQAVGARAFYAGSPDMHRFEDQPAEEKGFWLHDTQVGISKFIPSHPRPLLRIEEAGLEDALKALPTGAIVQLELAEARDAATIRAMVAATREAGAANVRVIAPEVARAYRGAAQDDLAGLGLRAQMEAWLDQQGFPREPALTIAGEIIGSFEEGSDGDATT